MTKNTKIFRQSFLYHPHGPAGCRQLSGNPHNIVLEHIDSQHASLYWNKEVTFRFPKHLVALLEALYIDPSVVIRWNGRHISALQV